MLSRYANYYSIADIKGGVGILIALQAIYFKTRLIDIKISKYHFSVQRISSAFT